LAYVEVDCNGARRHTPGAEAPLSGFENAKAKALAYLEAKATVTARAKATALWQVEHRSSPPIAKCAMDGAPVRLWLLSSLFFLRFVVRRFGAHRFFVRRRAVLG
jgi:hypothetical protein